MISKTPDISRKDLARALRRITALPLEDGNGAKLEYVSQLVLLGERADDPWLHDVLKDILREQYGSLATTPSQARMNTIEPLFAASRGVAQDCCDRLNYPVNIQDILCF